MPLPDGLAVALHSAQNLLQATPTVLAVLRPDAHEMAGALTRLGCQVKFCAQADQGMGATLAFAIVQTSQARGWLIALADMPWVAPATMTALVAALAAGATIAVPVCQGRRGNPVAFSQIHGPDLLACSGDSGARHLLATGTVTEVAVQDHGIWRDVDRPADLFPPMKTGRP